MFTGSGTSGGRPRCAVPNCRYFAYGGGRVCRSHDLSVSSGDGAGGGGVPDGAPSRDQQSFLSHMGLTSGDSRGLQLPDLFRFNPNLEDLIGERLKRWERGTPPSRRPDVARVLPLLTAAFGHTDVSTDYILNDLSTLVSADECGGGCRFGYAPLGGETILTEAARTRVKSGDYKATYRLGRTLGSGSYAKVKYYRWEKSGFHERYHVNVNSGHFLPF